MNKELLTGGQSTRPHVPILKGQQKNTITVEQSKVCEGLNDLRHDGLLRDNTEGTVKHKETR